VRRNRDTSQPRESTSQSQLRSLPQSMTSGHDVISGSRLLRAEVTAFLPPSRHLPPTFLFPRAHCCERRPGTHCGCLYKQWRALPCNPAQTTHQRSQILLLLLLEQLAQSITLLGSTLAHKKP
jgi:hypothetical protein